MRQLHGPVLDARAHEPERAVRGWPASVTGSEVDGAARPQCPPAAPARTESTTSPAAAGFGVFFVPYVSQACHDGCTQFAARSLGLEQACLEILGSVRHSLVAPFLIRTRESLEAHRPRCVGSEEHRGGKAAHRRSRIGMHPRQSSTLEGTRRCRRLPGHTAVAAGLCREQEGQGTIQVGYRRSRCPADRRLPRRPRAPAEKRREPVTLGLPRSARCSDTPPCAIPIMPASSSAFSPSLPSASTEGS